MVELQRYPEPEWNQWNRIQEVVFSYFPLFQAEEEIQALEKRYTAIQEELVHASQNLTHVNEELELKEKSLHAVRKDSFLKFFIIQDDWGYPENSVAGKKFLFNKISSFVENSGRKRSCYIG